MRSPQPSLEYLATCSQSSLEGFELARLDEISQLRREIQEVHEEWVEAEVAARLARLLIEGRRADLPAAAEAESLAPADSLRASPGIPQRTLPSPALHATSTNGVPPLLARKDRNQRACCSLAANRPAVADLAFEALAVPDPAGRLPSAPLASAAPAQKKTPSRQHFSRNRKRSTLPPPAKTRTAAPLRIRVSPQLALFDEGRPAPQQTGLPLRQLVDRISKRAILCLTARPRAAARPRLSLCEFPAAS